LTKNSEETPFAASPCIPVPICIYRWIVEHTFLPSERAHDSYYLIIMPYEHCLPAGGWKFQFVYSKKESLKVRKYQAFLLQLRTEFESKFNAMSPDEGKAEWTTRTDGKAPPDNMFAQFTYKCIKAHEPQGPEHGTWTLLWNPKKANVENHLHARCAPTLFKELSNQIQRKLTKEFKEHFQLNWKNGISGYDRFPTEVGGSYVELNGGGGRRRGLSGRDLMQLASVLSNLNCMDSDDDDCCPHGRSWAFCRSCSGN